MLQVITPPSPNAPKFLSGCKLKQPKTPNDPTLFLLNSAPTAWAQSSIIEIPYFFDIDKSVSNFAGFPVKWTGIIAFVLFVILLSIKSVFIFKS